LSELLGWEGRAAERFFTAYREVLPEKEWPSLLLMPQEGRDLAGWLTEAIRSAASLVLAAPGWAVAVAAPEAEVVRHLETAQESKALALAREGLGRLPAIDAATVMKKIEMTGLPGAQVSAAAREVVERGADDSLVASLVEAARAASSLVPEDPSTAERARSKAEAFLFDLLDSHPATTGLFRLNGELDFYFGPRRAEVDILCVPLKVAVELDGAYWHLGDADAYRRDRRKDWELQRRGFLVVRFLAEDVVCRLQDVFDTIRAAVELRKDTSGRRGGSS
jgi:very-short-patch-repair endonuclease